MLYASDGTLRGDLIAVEPPNNWHIGGRILVLCWELDKYQSGWVLERVHECILIDVDLARTSQPRRHQVWWLCTRHLPSMRKLWQNGTLHGPSNQMRTQKSGERIRSFFKTTVSIPCAIQNREDSYKPRWKVDQWWVTWSNRALTFYTFPCSNFCDSFFVYSWACWIENQPRFTNM